MCIICVQFEKGKLTRFEAEVALREFILTDKVDTKHALEIYDKLSEEPENDQSEP